MFRIELTETERQALVETFKTTEDRRLRERCQAVLMAGNGRRRRQIAQDLVVHRASVHAWLKSYRRQGLEGLKIHWAPGQPARIPPRFAPIIIDWVKKGPMGCGLNRANWSFAELATHLYQTHGIEVSETASAGSSAIGTGFARIGRPTVFFEATLTFRRLPARASRPLKKRPKRASACF